MAGLILREKFKFLTQFWLDMNILSQLIKRTAYLKFHKSFNSLKNDVELELVENLCDYFRCLLFRFRLCSSWVISQIFPYAPWVIFKICGIYMLFLFYYFLIDFIATSIKRVTSLINQYFCEVFLLVKTSIYTPKSLFADFVLI